MWRGVRVRDILALADGPRPTAQWVAVLAGDEDTSALPLEVVVDPGTLLVYEMNGEVLPREHGYPARLLVPDRYGMKNPKWVVGLRPLQREFLDWYAQRQWSKQGVVRAMCRIDAPAPGAMLPAGVVRLAGIAYAGSRQVQRVEVSQMGARVRNPPSCWMCRGRARTAGCSGRRSSRWPVAERRWWPAPLMAPARCRRTRSRCGSRMAGVAGPALKSMSPAHERSFLGAARPEQHPPRAAWGPACPLSLALLKQPAVPRLWSQGSSTIARLLSIQLARIVETAALSAFIESEAPCCLCFPVLHPHAG